MFNMESQKWRKKGKPDRSGERRNENESKEGMKKGKRKWQTERWMTIPFDEKRK